MASNMDKIVVRESANARRRQDIISQVENIFVKIEKNAADDFLNAYSYDAQLSVARDVAALDSEIKVVYEDNDFGMYYQNDFIAIREEDGTAEPLPSTKEEFRKIVTLDKVTGSIILDSPLSNAYTAVNAKVYLVVKTGRIKSGLDTVVASTEIFRNS